MLAAGCIDYKGKTGKPLNCSMTIASADACWRIPPWSLEAEVAMEDESLLYMQPKIDIQNGNQITWGRGCWPVGSAQAGAQYSWGISSHYLRKAELIVKLNAICLSTHAVGTGVTWNRAGEAGGAWWSMFKSRPVPE